MCDNAGQSAGRSGGGMHLKKRVQDQYVLKGVGVNALPLYREVCDVLLNVWRKERNEEFRKPLSKLN